MKKYLLILIMILLVPNTVFGNSGPPIVDPIDQSVMFDENSGISLTEEWVTIAFKERSFEGSNELDLWTGHVSVKYMLKNLDNKEKDLDVLFISPEIDSASISIKINGEEIEGITVEEKFDVPKNWDPKTPKRIVEPYSNKELYKTPNTIYSPNHNYRGIKFKVDFEPNEVVTLDISYESISGFYRGGDVASMVYSQIYYLTPAKFWEGDSTVNLRVEFPRGYKTKLHSNIPLTKINNYTYEGTLDKIPEEEWVLTFVDSTKLIFWTNNRAAHNTLVILIALIAFIYGRVLLKKESNFYGVLLWLLSIAFLIYFIKPTYGFMFLVYIFGPWIILAVAVLMAISRYNRKKMLK